MTTPARPPIETTLRSSLGYYVCAEAGGGREAIADRIEVGPWEVWIVTFNDDDTVSLQADNGQYLTAEIDGTVVCRGTSAGEWERFTIEVRDDAIVCFKTHHGTYLQAPQGGGPGSRLVQVDDDPPRPGEWEFFLAGTKFWAPAAPPPGTVPIVARPLVGPLRIQDRLFRDDVGFRRVHFCSWFPALRILRDDPTEFYRQLDSIVTHGYQGVRVFLAVGGWMGYWDAKEVVPITFTKWVFTGNHMRTEEYGDTLEAWPNYDELLRELLRACVARKLRLHVTTGDMQIICPDPNDEIDLHGRLAQICAEEGGLAVVAVAETTNEFPLNRAGGESDASIEQMGGILDVWTDALPGVLTMQGAIPQNEEPASLYKASTFGDTCAVHVTRDPIGTCIKRTLGLVYWEGDYRAFEKPYWEGEPAGPGDDSYQRQDDPANLLALYSMMALTGQASNWFQGAAVRSDLPLESEWGFQEIPAILDAWLPEDIALWDHGSNQAGGIEYWWKGNDFRTAVYEDWDPSPPRPIATWTLYTGTGVVQGKGAPQVTGTQFRTRKTYMAGVSAPARGTGLLVGTFA